MSILESLEQADVANTDAVDNKPTAQNQPEEIPIPPPVDCPSPDCTYWSGEHGEGGVCAYPDGCWWEIR
jgi:hypothetical protein